MYKCPVREPVALMAGVGGCLINQVTIDGQVGTRYGSQQAGVTGLGYGRGKCIYFNSQASTSTIKKMISNTPFSQLPQNCIFEGKHFFREFVYISLHTKRKGLT